MSDKQTHFGFKTVAEEEKARKVAEVFHSVANRYDVMNDLMSMGLHRVWKRFLALHARLRPGHKVLDIAGGTGDIARLLAEETGPTGEVWLTDINGSMLGVGRDRMLDKGLMLPVAQCDAEKLPFPGRLLRSGHRGLRPAQHDPQGSRPGRDAARA
jgi:demethylmenaquinone methyltransferase/2-methoxy-6-polyprenyl-1,4-benzoquinol methylase